MSWDIDVREKVYQRLANEVFFRILHGKYALGAKLPSYIDLAKEAGSSPETVRKAFRELQQHGVIEKTRRGYFVTSDNAVVAAFRERYLASVEEESPCESKSRNLKIIRSDPAPPDGERKKPLQGRLLSCAQYTYPCGGFEKIKAAVPYVLNKGVTPMR